MLIDGIPLSAAISTVIVIVATIVIAKFTNRLLKGHFKEFSRRLKVDETQYTFIRRLMVASICLFGIMTAVSMVPPLRSMSVTLLAGAGFAGIVIGLAAQSTLSNIVSGIALATFEPFRVGDYITIREDYGRVQDITLRHTVIKTWDNRHLILPNSIISDELIINWTIEDPTIKWSVDVGISYDADIDLARMIMLEEADSHPNVMGLEDMRRHHPDVTDVAVVKMTELGDFAANLRLTFWVRDRPTAWDVGCDLLESIKKRFDQAGIEIPFPYRTIVYKKELIQSDIDHN